MPALKFKVPSYRRHKASGQAVVTLDGKDIYVGPYGTTESRSEYERILNEWLTNHRRMPPDRQGRGAPEAADDLTLSEIFLSYWEFVQQYHRKNGRPTSEVSSIQRALKPLLLIYGKKPARTFGPLAFKVCRQQMIDAGLSRSVINKHTSRAKRFLRWATEHELVHPDVYHSIRTVAGLRRGRSAAPESKPIGPVLDEVVDAILPHLNRYVAAMIELQRLTGMRPCEVTIIRGRDLDTTTKVWSYRPQFHKTEHHERPRVIYLGPQAQEILKPFLLTDAEAYLFSPKLAAAENWALRRLHRKTPLTPGQRNRRPKPNPRKKPGEYYRTSSYEHSIWRGCDKAFPIPASLSGDEAKEWRRQHRWSPNRLRHTAATRLRQQFGIEAARVVLGHSSPATTEIYAEMDLKRAADIMAAVG